MARRKRLTDAGIARLAPGAREYTVRDTLTDGLGVRVRPSGSRTFVWWRRTAAGLRKTSFGPAALRRVQDVRRDCRAAAAAEAAVETAETCNREAVPTFRAFVEGPWKTACLDRCKTSTRGGFNGLLRRQLMPAFADRPLDRIEHAGVARWFDRASRTAPGTANKALELLRNILGHAAACGLVERNTARGIRRNPSARITRFLSREEIHRLHQTLDSLARRSASKAQQADIVRLLLLTGCRRNEIVRLHRDEVKHDRLELSDSKTGPRTVPLSEPARAILQRRMAQTPGPWVFPSPRDPARHRCSTLTLWYRARREAGIPDVRLHDLRHTFASQAALNRVPLNVVARLLGHASLRTTLRYAHVGDREVEDAAERVGNAIANMLAGKPPDATDGPDPGHDAQAETPSRRRA